MHPAFQAVLGACQPAFMQRSCSMLIIARQIDVRLCQSWTDCGVELASPDDAQAVKLLSVVILKG